MRDLDLPGDQGSLANAVNDSGQVTGFVIQNGTEHAFLYSNGVVKVIDGIVPGQPSVGYGVSPTGQVVGGSRVGSDGWHAFSYQNGVCKDLDLWPSRASNARAINASGLIVGEALSDDTEYGFVDSANYLLDLNRLGSSPEPLQFERATAVNASGQIVGVSYGHNILRSFLYSNGAFTDIGELDPGTGSMALAINDLGDVVGYSSFTNPSRAYLYTGGRLLRLNDCLDGSSQIWGVEAATGINNSGQIVAVGHRRFGLFNSHAPQRALLLTPTD